MIRRAFLVMLGFAALLAGGLVLLVLNGSGGRADDQQSILAGVISQALSSPDIRVSVGAVDGPLSSKSTIRNIVLSDRDGPFLTVDQVQLEWRRAALLSRRLEVDRLQIGKVDYTRKPFTTARPATANEPLLPELPLKVIVKAFELGELALGEPVVGQAARLGASGKITLGPPTEGLDSEIAIRRFDRDGEIALKLLFVPQGATLDLVARVNEGQGGLIAHVASIPGAPPVTLDLKGAGPLDNWKADLGFQAGPEIDAKGTALLQRQGAGRNLALDISGRIGALLPPLLGDLFAGTTTVTGRAALHDDGGVKLDQARLASDLAELGLSGTISANRTLDLALRLGAKASGGNPARYRDTSIDALSLEAKAVGPALGPDLSGTLTARGLKRPGLALGNADATFAIRQAGATPGSIIADAKIDGLVLATAEATRAAGGSVALRIRGALDASFVADLTEASIATPTAHIGWTGRIGAGVADGAITGGIPDLAAFEPRLKGAATLAGTLKGLGETGLLALDLAAPAVEAAGKPVRNLVLAVSARDPLGKTNGTLKATGQIDGNALTASAAFSRDGAKQTLRDLVFNLGDNRINGALDAEAGLIDGRIALDLRRLEQLSALLLSPASGALTGTLDLARSEDRQRIAGKLVGPNIRAFGAAIRGLDTEFVVDDLAGIPRPSGRLRAEALGFGSENFGRVSLLATPTETGTDITLEGRGVGTSTDLVAGITHGDEIRIDLRRLAATRSGASVRLTAPASIVIRDGTARFERIALAIGAGTLTVAGTAGKVTALALKATAVSLASLRAVAPGLDLAGTLDAEANLSGDLARPSGAYSVNIRGLSHPALRSAALPALGIQAKGALRDGRATVDATIAGSSRLALTVSGSAPTSGAGALDLAIKGTLDAALANASLSGGQRLAGQVRVDATVKGSAASPVIAGGATIAGGSFTDPLQGLRFTNISGRLVGAGDRIRVEQVRASTPGGGMIAVNGSLIADPVRGLPAELKITGSNARLVENDVMILVADLDLGVNGPLTGAPTLTGAVRIGSLDIMIPDRLASASAPLPNAKHIAPPKQTRDRLAMIEKARKQRAQRRAATGGGAKLAIRLDAPSRISVRGRGVDAELGGSLMLSGTVHAPRATGAFDLRRGQLDLLTQRVEFTRGRITFNGDIVPELDFQASTSAGEITARIAITGPADDPVFALSSSPQLPQDEVLSRLLFARAAGALSPFQAIQLAQAVARLSGKGGPDFLDRTRRALGVDTLDVDVGKNGPTVGASRYITRNIRLGVKTGATPEESGLSVNVDVTRRIKLKGEATKDGRGSVGIGAEIEY
jgi:translocation and assembly module TamB